MSDLVYRLLLFLNSSKEKSINYTIATTLLHNIRKINSMNINQIADMCYTSPAAISRFCRKLGYENLSEFKINATGRVLKHESTDLIPKEVNGSISRDVIFNRMYKEIEDGLEEALEKIDLKVIDRVLELIYSKEKICLFGTRFSQLMIQDLQLRFAALGKLMNVAIDIQEQENLSKGLDEKSLAVLVSPTGRFVKYHENIWDIIKKSNSAVVVITGNENNEYKDDADYIIYYCDTNKENSLIEAQRYSLAYLIEYMQIRYCSIYYNS